MVTLGDCEPPCAIDFGRLSVRFAVARDVCDSLPVEQTLAVIVSPPPRTRYSHRVGEYALNPREKEDFRNSSVRWVRLPCSPEPHVPDVEDWERLLHGIYYNWMRRAPEEHPSMFVLPPFVPRKQIEELIEIAYETFDIPFLYLPLRPQLELFASGLVSGLVVELSHESSLALPFIEGQPLLSATKQSTASSGFAAISVLAQALGNADGGEIWRDSERPKIHSQVRQLRHLITIKDARLQVFASAAAADAALLIPDDTTDQFTLPDGTVVSIPKSAYVRAAESIFRPYLALLDTKTGSTSPPLSAATSPDLMEIVSSALDGSAQANELSQNVVLAGSSALVPGLLARFESELARRYPSRSTKLADEFRNQSEHATSLLARLPYDLVEDCVQRFPRRQRARFAANGRPDHAAILGALALSNFSSFQDYWLPKSTYTEIGSTILNRSAGEMLYNHFSNGDSQ